MIRRVARSLGEGESINASFLGVYCLATHSPLNDYQNIKATDIIFTLSIPRYFDAYALHTFFHPYLHPILATSPCNYKGRKADLAHRTHYRSSHVSRDHNVAIYLGYLLVYLDFVDKITYYSCLQGSLRKISYFRNNFFS